jgi:hypothetical protein
MADYSEHATLAAEWTGLLNFLAQDQNHDAGIQDLQTTKEVENRRRETLARKTLTKPGKELQNLLFLFDLLNRQTDRCTFDTRQRADLQSEHTCRRWCIHRMPFIST